ncbi:MAG TPA: prenyltransferase/squalene oxidase repeat-containing protein [Armatimonadota bacterium]|nr:prenyltransferase/squalene oxidase repeat-containing protein [Armatimonadota bacterium]
MTQRAIPHLASALETAVAHLLSRREPEGFWRGRLSASALATATAVSALLLGGEAADRPLIRAGIAWLRAAQRADGGWGDTPESPSNLPTTLLVLAAFRLAGEPDSAADRRYAVARAGRTPAEWRAAILRSYGADRTFAVPILMHGALAGLTPWAGIPDLPFELAAVPRAWYPALRLRVVSYALPALIAVGLLLDDRRPPRHPLLRAARRLAAPRVLDTLARIQPEHGGFLEAAPLTAFVAMALIGRFGAAHPVARRCLAFLRDGVRADGSWPIDTDLSVWVTTNALTALGAAGALEAIDVPAMRRWVAARQYTAEHPYTGAAPGGWGWTHRPGGVPDADDTAGAMLALARLGETAPLAAGARWLRGLQNRDGGWPTFCRGWGRLPFDTSAPDVTAHAVRALRAAGVGDAARRRGMAYLEAAQGADGAWTPLWFGNQATADGTNRTYGTARVLRAYAVLAPDALAAHRGVAWLVGAQREDGGWGGGVEAPSTIEETALALSALADWPQAPGVAEALTRGTAYLLRRIEAGSWTISAPIGLYFARLWYDEALYPVVWTVEALGRMRHIFGEAVDR